MNTRWTLKGGRTRRTWSGQAQAVRVRSLHQIRRHAWETGSQR